MSTTSAIANTQNTPGKTTTNPKSQLKVADFINLMVTQLQNQDPTSPTSNSELLQQMSQIGQLQSQDTLQTSLKDMVLQNNVGSASGMIGKNVSGTDATTGATLTGKVKGVSVAKGSVILKLDGGAELSMSNITSIENSTDDGDIGAAVAKSAGATGTKAA